MSQHPGLDFDALRCGSVLDPAALPPGTSRAFGLLDFGKDKLRASRVLGVTYFPALKLQVLDDNTVPLEAIQDPWSLKFELGRDFQGQAQDYRRPFEVAERDDEVCILANFYSRNFFHWITEELVKVIQLERSGFTGKYVLAGLPGFAAQFMALLGVGADRIVADLAGPTRFRSSVYTSAITSRQLDAHPELFFALRDALVPEAAVSAPASRRLWMDRNLGVNNPGRELLNTEEVYAVLARHGFEVVDFAAHDVAGQIAMAHGANVLSGPHGAGFIHTMFMRPRSQVIECYSPLFINPGVFEVCRLMRHRYFMIAHENCYEGYPYGNKLVVNCSHLELTLQSLA